ncbi:MAG: sugar porter family MFS transporter [Pirellulaceae bacterium]
MNQRLFFWSLTAALAGFLFGFDTVVISGAEKTVQGLWGLSNGMHGLTISMALWGTVVGSLIGGWPSDRFGRKRTLIGIGWLYFVSAVWSGMATDEWSFMIARFIGGVGVGISTIASPLYIAEISPPERRGRLAGMFQFNIVFGILIAFLSNYMIGQLITDNAWRWMLGIEAIPALIYTVMCFGIPRSPRWLIARHGDRESAMHVLRQINESASEEELCGLADEIEKASKHEAPGHAGSGFWSNQLRIPILLAFLVAFFNQLSGINAILYFAPRIFQLAGLGENAALLNSVGIGVTNLLFTFVGLYLIDRLGRRTLLYIGSFGYIASLGLCAWTFFSFAPQFQVANTAISLQNSVDSLEKASALEVINEQDINKITVQREKAIKAFVAATSTETYEGEAAKLDKNASSEQIQAVTNAALSEAAKSSGAGGTIVLLCIFAFIAAHAVGQGAVIWVLISEIFPNRYRAAGQALGCFTHWIFAASLTMVFPWMISTFAPGFVFGFFCFMMVLQLIWVATMVPETKGVPLEEMQTKLGVKP